MRDKDLQSNGGQVGIQGTKEQRQEGDVEKGEGLMGDMGRNHQTDCVSERQANVQDPGDHALVHNMGRSVQPKVGYHRHAHVGHHSEQCWCYRQVLVLARLNDVLETNVTQIVLALMCNLTDATCCPAAKKEYILTQ